VAQLVLASNVPVSPSPKISLFMFIALLYTSEILCSWVIMDSELIPPPIQLPRALSDVSTLSSVSDIDESKIVELEMRTEDLLKNYVPSTKEDDTTTILRCFLELLPKRGRIQLMLDIEQSAEQSSLRDLREYLMGTLIIPSKVLQ
jgi:hypothetical protein